MLSIAKSATRTRFKLHLRPEHLDSNEINRRELPALPPGKTVIQVFADFLAYLFSCAQRYIVDTHASGQSLWNSLKDQIDFVLSHPNGWEGLQQGKMRQAAVLAGLVPDDAAGYACIHFVTEGEASLHFCVQSGLTTSSIEVSRSSFPNYPPSVPDVCIVDGRECHDCGRRRRHRRHQQLRVHIDDAHRGRGDRDCRV